jgi:hypothetical protein
MCCKYNAVWVEAALFYLSAFSADVILSVGQHMPRTPPSRSVTLLPSRRLRPFCARATHKEFARIGRTTCAVAAGRLLRKG